MENQNPEVGPEITEEKTSTEQNPEKDMILYHFAKGPARIANERFHVLTSSAHVKNPGSGKVVGVINYVEYCKIYKDAKKANERAAELNTRYHLQ